MPPPTLDGCTPGYWKNHTGAARILLRAGTSAYLNARHDGIDYPLSASDVIISVDVALSGGSRDAMLALAASLDANNNLGCPLN